MIDRMVMDYINFIPKDLHKEQVKTTMKKKLFNEAVTKAIDLKNNKFLSQVDWKTVYDNAG